MAKTQRELFQQDESIRTEADVLLKETPLGRLLNAAGYKPVGSYVMRTMTWRDLDFERADKNPDWEQHLDFASKLMRLQWLWEFDYMNTLTHPFTGLPAGLYLGLRGDYPAGGKTWKFDLWTAPAEEFEPAHLRMAGWLSKHTDETRYYILDIKDALCNTLEYRRAIHSVDIYEAVLDCGVKTLEEFRAWWTTNHEK